MLPVVGVGVTSARGSVRALDVCAQLDVGIHCSDDRRRPERWTQGAAPTRSNLHSRLLYRHGLSSGAAEARSPARRSSRQCSALAFAFLPFSVQHTGSALASRRCRTGTGTVAAARYTGASAFVATGVRRWRRARGRRVRSLPPFRPSRRTSLTRCRVISVVLNRACLTAIDHRASRANANCTASKGTLSPHTRIAAWACCCCRCWGR
jgi:hypothetical protein